MIRTVFLFALLLALPAFAAGQNQTRERRSNDSEPVSTGSSAVRNRVVGPPRSANHVEKVTPASQKPASQAKEKSGSITEANPQSTDQVKQTNTEPRWGNTAVVVRPAPDMTALAGNSSKDRQAIPAQDKKSVKKLVQQTALSPAAAKPNSPNALVPRGPAPTVVYHVGIGDVLDIRLSNLPTRESTLFTVMKNGSLEYPLLSEPLAVAGMSTDEISNLLGNEIKVIKTARVSVDVRDYASHIVVVTGLVDSPGRKVLRREAMPLFAVLAEALPRPEATVAIIARNGNNQTIALTNEQAMSTLVLTGDVITISGATAPRFVYVGGDVASRGEKEFRAGMTLTQSILSAGGVAGSSKASVKVARRNSGGFLISVEYNLQSIEEGKSPDPLLQAGDRIEVRRGM